MVLGEIMTKIRILKSDNQKITLQIDLKDYYQAYLDLCANPLSEKYIKNFNLQKNAYSIELSDVNGELLWRKIKENLASLCNNENKNEALLANLLTKTHEKALPMAIKSLNLSFVELLKNTVDAAIKNRAIDHDGLIEMFFEISIESDNIVILISDNAGGFPQEYLSQFDSYVVKKEYQLTSKSNNKVSEELNCYFGGNGRGVPIFLSYLLDGAIMISSGKLEKRLNVSRTSVQIENIKHENDKLGAKIQINSPLTPCEEYKEAKSVGQRKSFFSIKPMSYQDILSPNDIKVNNLCNGM